VPSPSAPPPPTRRRQLLERDSGASGVALGRPAPPPHRHQRRRHTSPLLCPGPALRGATSIAPRASHPGAEGRGAAAPGHPALTRAGCPLRCGEEPRTWMTGSETPDRQPNGCLVTPREPPNRLRSRASSFGEAIENRDRSQRDQSTRSAGTAPPRSPLTSWPQLRACPSGPPWAA